MTKKRVRRTQKRVEHEADGTTKACATVTLGRKKKIRRRLVDKSRNQKDAHVPSALVCRSSQPENMRTMAGMASSACSNDMIDQ